MSELTFEQMLEESFKTIRNGEVVDGTVCFVAYIQDDFIRFNVDDCTIYKKRIY